MEVIAVAERERRWRWEIRHNGRVVKESGERFVTPHDAIEDGKLRLVALWTGADRPPITRQPQRRRAAAS